MTTDAFELSPKQQLSLTMVQCLIQGLLISLFATFLSTRSTRPPIFIAYVISVNLLSIGQTIISVLQAIDLLDPVSYSESLVLAYSTHTVVIGAGVQAFFLNRCWRIFKKRVLLAILLVVLGLLGLTAGIMMVVYKAQLSATSLAYHANPQDEALRLAFDAADIHTSRALTVWAFSWFVLELGMTVITIVFLYQVRTGLPAHDGIFRTICRGLWKSATPPLILMAIVIIDGYVTPGSPSAASRISVAITAKFFALSLMINLSGQGHIRKKFERARPTPSGIHSNRPGLIISEAIFAPGILSPDSCNTDVRDSGYDADSTRSDSLEAHHHQHGGDIEKHQPDANYPSACG